MAEIEKRGYFDFECSTPSYKKIKCIMKDGAIVTVNFDRLQITYIGTVRIWIDELNKFVTIQQILPSTNPEDEKYYSFISKEIEMISLKRKAELKEHQKRKQDRRRMSA